jgi:hypothetical protein
MSKKTYELSISRNYVHTWGVEDAIREIMQNAIDSQADGHRMSIYYANGTLEIVNQGTTLDISTLVLGNSDKTDHTKYIGTYGEGFKLAMIVLLRNNVDVFVYTNGQVWRPEFRMSTKFKIDTLHIDVSPDASSTNSITFELQGIDLETFEAIRDNNLAMAKAMGYSIGDTIDTKYGEILISPKYKGKMFVNGLYVQSDSSFQYGYNFKPEYVPLDRDRKAISYYKMRELTAKALSDQKNVQIVHTALKNSYTDIRDIIDHMNEISKEFKVNFAQAFIKNNGLDDDTFVGLEKEVLVANKPKSFRTTSQAIADLVNAGQDRTEEYQQIKQKVKEQSKVEEAWMYYNGSSFKQMIDYLFEHKDAFDIDALVEEIKSWTDLHTMKFNLIAEEVLAEFYEEDIENVVAAIQQDELKTLEAELEEDK